MLTCFQKSCPNWSFLSSHHLLSSPCSFSHYLLSSLCRFSHYLLSSFLPHVLFISQLNFFLMTAHWCHLHVVLHRPLSLPLHLLLDSGSTICLCHLFLYFLCMLIIFCSHTEILLR